MAMAPGLVHHDRSAEVMRKSDALDLEQRAFTWRNPKHIARSLKRSAERSTAQGRCLSVGDVHVDLLHQSRRGEPASGAEENPGARQERVETADRQRSARQRKQKANRTLIRRGEGADVRPDGGADHAPFSQIAQALAVALAGTSLVAYLEREPRKARGQYIDDAAIITKVKAVLVQDQSLDGLQIGVKT
jgi:osmotically-inducible protein OsmY